MGAALIGTGLDSWGEFFDTYGMADWSSWLGVGNKKPPDVDDPQIYPRELQESGVVIQRGDPRIGPAGGPGISFQNMTPQEKAAVIKRRRLMLAEYLKANPPPKN
jgi:hypothetical protein